MMFEAKVIIPAARKHLTDYYSQASASAFRATGDRAFRSRRGRRSTAISSPAILNLAPEG